MAAPDNFDGFEWDEEKSARCHEERGFDFDYATKLFDGDFIEMEDRRRDWGEPRFVNIGRGRRADSRRGMDSQGNPKANYLGATGIEVGEGETK